MNTCGNIRLDTARLRNSMLIFVSYLAIKIILRCWYTKHINEATICQTKPTLQKFAFLCFTQVKLQQTM